MKITNCSMGCMYATGPIEKCLCSCDQTLHGLLAHKPVTITCSPHIGKRCMEGKEGADCKCACQGINHGIHALHHINQ